ncbi:MAG: FecR domain-containing protein [Bacteroidales bacterium]
MNKCPEKNTETTLMIRYLLGKGSLEDNERLLKLLKEHPEKMEKLSELRKAYIFGNSKTNIPTTEKNNSSAKKKNISFYKITASVAVLLLLAISVFFVHTHKSQNTQPEPIQQVIAQTQNNQETVKLIDGSIVTLNTHSVLEEKSDFNTYNRTLYLQGEAFFDVTHNENKPFIINVNNLLIEVLGTKFNVHQDSGTITVSVTEGKVLVKSDKEYEFITTDEQITFNTNTQEFSTIAKSHHNSNSWKTGVLEFRDTPIQEALSLINTHYGFSYKIGSPELKKHKINALFCKSDTSQISDLLSIMLNVTIKKENEKQILYSQSKQK